MSALHPAPAVCYAVARPGHVDISGSSDSTHRVQQRALRGFRVHRVEHLNSYSLCSPLDKNLQWDLLLELSAVASDTYELLPLLLPPRIRQLTVLSVNASYSFYSCLSPASCLALTAWCLFVIRPEALPKHILRIYLCNLYFTKPSAQMFCVFSCV